MLKKIRIALFAEEKTLNNPKLNSTVSVVRITDNIIEFFKSNTRSQVRIKVSNDAIFNIVNSLDGKQNIDDIAKNFSVEKSELYNLINWLLRKGLLDTSEPHSDFDNYNQFRRVIHFIEEYASSHIELMEMWNNIQTGKVLIVGLGAVGTWVACNLVQSGIKEIFLQDGDVVEETNLHRQFGYTEKDIGNYKVDVLEKRLKKYNSDILVHKSYDFIADGSLRNHYDKVKLDLIINCADKPNVDKTSLWIGEFAMQKRIPHIIGGGYNLHHSLIGQTVIPGKSACVKCFQKTLQEENKIDVQKVKKLLVKNRKIGSFGPMCSIIASLIGMEAIKILTKKIAPSNINKRGEFDILHMNISYKYYEKRDDCEWCGKNGIYVKSTN